jgi:uncharacterized protein YuzE
MKVHYDPAADALYLRLDETPIAESEEVRPGVILDLDARDNVVGIELLRVSERTTPENLREISVRVA